jgi:hypothetical protein
MISNTEQIYPFCYKIKENCIPCNKTPCTSCLKELSKFNSKVIKNDMEKEKDIDDLFNCLKKYGDIYKKLDIELYVNPKTKQITFPTNLQIQSKLNLYLDSMDFNTKPPSAINNQDEKLMLFNILLNDKLRNEYNNFYYSNEFADLDSLMPKKYGIDKIMDTDYDSTGGRKIQKYIKAEKRMKTKKYIKTKKRMKNKKYIKTKKRMKNKKSIKTKKRRNKLKFKL